MKRKIKYTDEPTGVGQVIPDFLPRPWELADKPKGVKVTITLSQPSVRYFKRIAKKYNAPYQQMIRRLLDFYMSSNPRI